MAYSTSNPPALVTQRVGASSGAIWIYQSTDPLATVRAAGYFSNASDLGMKVNDLVFVVDTDQSPETAGLHIVHAIDSDGAADLSDNLLNATADSD